MQTDYVELCYTRKKKIEKRPNNEIIVLQHEAHARIEHFSLVRLQIGPRSEELRDERDDKKERMND